MNRWEYLISNLIEVGVPDGVFKTEYYENGVPVIRCNGSSCQKCPYDLFNRAGNGDCNEERAKDYSLIIANLYENHPELLL
jgi:hypothetical protein